MNKKIWIILITLIIGIIAFMLGPVLWSNAPDMVLPNSQQLPFLIFLSVIESLLFGYAIAFIIFYAPLLNKVKQRTRNRNILAFISLVWLLISWWPHDNLHRHIGMDWNGLIFLEYGFHLTLIIASLILAYHFIMTLKESRN